MSRHKSQNFVNLVSSTMGVVQMISMIHQLIAVLVILQMMDCGHVSCAHLVDSHEEEHLKNPLVFDLNTLYDKTRVAKSNSIVDWPHGKRFKRSSAASKIQNQEPQLVDACQSKVEVLTPYYATNSKGKIRTVVNSALMQQAIQVETCVRSPSADRAKCNAQPDCGCEQKYKWHRLLVLDTSDSGSSRGLFMDWFLYPSACACRCKSSSSGSSKQFLRTIRKANETPI